MMTKSDRSDAQVLFIGNELDREDIDSVFESLNDLGVQGALAHPDELILSINGETTELYWRGSQIYPKLIIGWVFEEVLLPGMTLLTALEASGFQVINGAQILFEGQNKFINSARLAAAKVPHLPVLCGHGSNELTELAYEKIGYPAVGKPVVGAGGQSVVRHEDRNSLLASSTVLDGLGEYTYVQSWLSKEKNQDIRIVCVDYKPIYAYSRTAPPNTWITNIMAGGLGIEVEITPELEEIATRSAHALSARIAGVDVVQDEATGRFYVFEVNTCPTLKISRSVQDGGRAVEEAVAAFFTSLI